MNISVSDIYKEVLMNISSRIPINFGNVSSNNNSSINSLTLEELSSVYNYDVQDFPTTFYEILSQMETSEVDEIFDFSGLNIDDMIKDAISMASNKYDIDESLITAVIRQESNFNPDAVSSAGAMGLMQLMPATAESLGVTDAFDIYQNINGGTEYLRKQLDRFDSTELALAAYNAGPGNVIKYDGIPPFEETQNYVPKVLNYQQSLLEESGSSVNYSV